jgi:hypothetical protein
MDTTSKRPPPASKEEASSNRVFQLPRKPAGQPSEQTSARVWIGFDWISIFIETQQNNDRGVCIGHQHAARRTRDPDEAAKACRVAADRCCVDVRITPKGRAGGDGLRLAYELKQRGIDVSFDTLDEREERNHEHEITWADTSAGLADRPLPELSRLAARFRETLGK